MSSSTGDQEATKRENDEESELASSAAVQRLKFSAKSSAPKQISNLPVEILQKILEYAVGDSKVAGFLNPTLVCVQWNEIVSNSRWIMRQQSAKIEIRTVASAEKTSDFKITRDYREFALSGPHSCYKYWDLISTSIVPTIMSSLTLNLRKLTIYHLSLPKIFFEALQSLAGLHSLSFICCSGPDDVDTCSVALKNLQRLALIASDLSILSCLTCKELDSFTFEKRKLATPLITFLNNLDRLDEVNMRIRTSSYDNSWVLKPKFKWSLLNAYVDGAAMPFYVALLQASSQNSEAHITLNKHWPESLELLISFFNNCPAKIKSLSMAKGRFSVPMNLRRLDEMERLEIEGNHAFSVPIVGDGFKLFVEQKLSNIKELIWRNAFGSSNLMELSATKMSLEHLDISHIFKLSELVHADGQVPVYPFLRSLTVQLRLKYLEYDDYYVPDYYESTENLWKFCSVNRSLIHLNIKVVGIIIHQTQFSLISFYRDWMANGNTTSVETCSLTYRRHGSDESHGLRKSRQGMELEIFGRLLSNEEHMFFKEINIEDYKSDDMEQQFKNLAICTFPGY